MVQSKYVGVDGCPYGWFSVGLDDRGEWQGKTFLAFGDLLTHYANASLILVDIPIGLPEKGEARDCDRNARKLLNPGRSRSVFPAPTRQAAERAAQCPGPPSKAKLDKLRSYGIRMNLQTLGISSKIIEVDKLIVPRGPKSAQTVREVHPELCFWAFNNGEAMKHGKKTKGGKGINERLAILREVLPRTDDIFSGVCRKYLRSDVARDDILDALAAALTAYRVLGQGLGQLKTAPETPPKDCKGLPMEMVYWAA